jgi:hypothetical protein
MSIDTRLELSKSCEVVLTEYDGGFGSTLTLDYVEHSSDWGHPDEETSVDIDKEMAIAIIAILQKAYELGNK